MDDYIFKELLTEFHFPVTLRTNLLALKESLDSLNDIKQIIGILG